MSVCLGFICRTEERTASMDVRGANMVAVAVMLYQGRREVRQMKEGRSDCL